MSVEPSEAQFADPQSLRGADVGVAVVDGLVVVVEGSVGVVDPGRPTNRDSARRPVGAKALFLGLVTLPSGGRTKSHIHEYDESAFYLLSGDEVELWTGEKLEHKDVAHQGDFLFIPAKVPHVAVNRGDTAAVFIGVRNEATAQESVVMMPELDPLVP